MGRIGLEISDRRLAAVFAVGLATGMLAAQTPPGAPPLEWMLGPAQRAALEERIRTGIADLRSDLALDRFEAARELGTLGGLAEEALLRALPGSGSAAERRAGLHALVLLGPSQPTLELARTWASEGIALDERRFWALLELGAPGPEGLSAPERAAALARWADPGSAATPFVAETAAFALVRLRARDPDTALLRSIFSGTSSRKLRGALAIHLGRFDPEAAPMLREHADRERSGWVRACCWLGLSYAAAPAGRTSLGDLDDPSGVLALAAAWSRIPHDLGELNGLAQRLDGENRPAVVGGLVGAIALSGLPEAEAFLLQRVGKLGLVRRRPLLQAAVRLRSPALLLAVHEALPPTVWERGEDFAALAAIRCLGTRPGERVLVADPAGSERVGAVLDAARAVLAEGAAGAVEAAWVLAVHDRDPGEQPRAPVGEEAELARVLQAGALLRAGHLDERSARRLGIALAMRRQVDPESWRDWTVQRLAESALGFGALPFETLGVRQAKDRSEPGENDLSLPADEGSFPFAKTGEVYSDLVYWFGEEPFRIPLADYL